MTSAVNPTSKEALIATFNQPRAAESDAAESVQDRFLTLLVTQMRNQDPLNPMDNAEVTTQLAQISTVSGIDKLNKSMQAMSQGLLAAQSMQASGLIGRGVLAPGSTLVLANGQAKAGATLAGPADRVVVSVLDRAGAQVAMLDLGARPAGALTFAWDGKTAAGSAAPDGIYTFQVAAVQGNGKVAVEPLGYGRVQSVTLGDQGLQLNTYGLGALAMSSVRQIL
jgi:flagellar basal-body rod modification protein FlgD